MLKGRILLSEVFEFVAPIVIIGAAAFGGWYYAQNNRSAAAEPIIEIGDASVGSESVIVFHSDNPDGVEASTERLLLAPDLSIGIPKDSEFLSRTPRGVYFGDHIISTSVFPTSIRMSVLQDLNQVSGSEFMVNVKRVDQVDIIDFSSATTSGRISIEMDIDGRTIVRVGARPAQG